MQNMNQAIKTYNGTLADSYQAICNLLATTIDAVLKEAENKIWHAHPVWFIDGNPIVGYSKEKAGIRLMFWSGADFEDVFAHKYDWVDLQSTLFYKTKNFLN
jgi:hypothetical protein